MKNTPRETEKESATISPWLLGLLVIVPLGLSEPAAQFLNPYEMPSGVTFIASPNPNDPSGTSNAYSWLAIDPAHQFNVFGLSITLKPAPQIAPCLARTCSDAYASNDGGVNWRCTGIVPRLFTSAFDHIWDPTCSFESKVVGLNDCYGSWLRYQSACTPPATTESDVVLNRVSPPWGLIPPTTFSCGPFDAAGPVTVFLPPPSACTPQGRYSEPYGLNEPFLVVDQAPSSPFRHTIYDAVVYWVGVSDPPIPNERPIGSYVFCTTGTAGLGWATSFGPPPVHNPTPANPGTTPGGRLVSDLGSSTTGEVHAPYVAVAPNGWVYTAWLTIEGAFPNQSGTIWMDRSIDGGLTWGFENGQQYSDCAVISIPASAILRAHQAGLFPNLGYSGPIVSPRSLWTCPTRTRCISSGLRGIQAATPTFSMRRSNGRTRVHPRQDARASPRLCR